MTTKYTLVGHFASANVSASCAASVFDVTPKNHEFQHLETCFQDVKVTMYEGPGKLSLPPIMTRPSSFKLLHAASAALTCSVVLI